FIASGEGLIEVGRTRVSVLTDLAVAADRIDEAKVEEARRRAEARLREKLSDEEVAYVNASLARSLAQLHVKRRQRKSRWLWTFERGSYESDQHVIRHRPAGDRYICAGRTVQLCSGPR